MNTRTKRVLASVAAFFQFAAAGSVLAKEKCPQFIDVRDTAEYLTTIDPDTINPKFLSSLSYESRKELIGALGDLLTRNGKEVKREFSKLLRFRDNMQGNNRRADKRFGDEARKIAEKYPGYRSVLDEVLNKDLSEFEVGQIVDGIQSQQFGRMKELIDKAAPEPVCITFER